MSRLAWEFQMWNLNLTPCRPARTNNSTFEIRHSTFDTPFDAVAQKYDLLFTDSRIGRAQRDAVWRKIESVFQPGQRILEINCGTGVDAVYLARLGVEVLALDSSSEMVAIAQRRMERESVQRQVRVQQWPIEQLDDLVEEGLFEGVLSNFGGLNCVGDFQKVGQDLAHLLKPGGPALLCLMGRWCCWEMLYYLSHLQPGKAFRRMRKDGTLAQLGGGGTLRVYYPSVSQLMKAFAPNFRLRSYQAIGLAVPPSYVEPWVVNHPDFLRRALRFDAQISRWPGFRSWGDHYLMHLERL